jgi:hypothetical protein
VLPTMNVDVSVMQESVMQERPKDAVKPAVQDPPAAPDRSSTHQRLRSRRSATA